MEDDVKVNDMSETYLSVPLDMELRNGKIFVSDFRGDSLLWCFSLLNPDLTKRLLPLGDGPDEYLSPVQFFIKDSLITVHNRWHYSLRFCKFDTINYTIKNVSHSISLPTEIDRIYSIRDDRWVASGRFDNYRFAIIDKDGNIISRCGDYPSYMYNEESISNFSKFMFHQSMFGYNNGIGRLASVTEHVLELWNDEKPDLYLHMRLLLSPYSYNYQEGEEWALAIADGKVEKGVERIYCTDNYIYMLYNPNTHQMISDKEDYKNSEIWIFDWECTPILKLKTGSKISCFCVDESKRVIYCIFKDKNYNLGYLNYEL
jgi:hypothetical protein